MSSLPRRRSRPSASAISISFADKVRGRRSSRRTACIVNVEAPETMWPRHTSWPSARSDGERVDPRMRGEAPVLGGDQHPPVERVDSHRP